MALMRELTEAREQQTATLEVLKVISGSPGDLRPVFATILANVVRLCEAKFANLHLYQNGGFPMAAQHGVPARYAELRRREPMIRPSPGSSLDLVARTKQVVHLTDIAADPAHDGHPLVVLGGARSLVCVPMLKEGVLIGALGIYRKEVKPFTDRQIELAQNFATQAVIAIENTRLLNELRQRTDDLTESLEQQTATSEVLRVISSSPGELKPVFDAMLGNAVRICAAKFGALSLFDDGTFWNVALHNIPPAYSSSELFKPFRPHPKAGLARVVADGRVVQTADLRTQPPYLEGDPAVVAIADLAGARTIVNVPMLKEGKLVGAISIFRQEVRPFTEKQVELVSNFAAQAVIAIENARLFDEIQEKSRQLAEASQHKSQFLANMSHELRTPLNAILGYTELMIDGIYGETPQKALDVLKRVESNGKHLLGLINDVLDFSKIEAGELKLALDDYSIKDVVYNVFSAVEPLAAKKNLNLKIDAPSDLPAARGDERKLTQVLLNLVGNAIKFTDAGEVAIKVAASNGSLSVAVHDTGPGIDPANQSKLFEEFQQADNSITKAKGGTGLGLAIARRIVELHGGHLWVESRLGAGATFTFTIPVMVKQQARPS
jgi:signal transduction histidine kinase